MPYLESVNIAHSQRFTIIAHTMVIFFLGMYSIFQPLYFYQNGVPVLWIIGYEIFYWTFSLLMLLPNFYVVARIGIKISFALGLVMRLTYLALLASLGFLLDQYNLIFVLLAIGVMQRLASGYYWLSFHSLFAGTFDGTREASGLGKLEALGRVGAILSPIIGGFLLTFLAPLWFFAFISVGVSVGILLYWFVEIRDDIVLKVQPRKILHVCATKDVMPYFSEGLIDRTQLFVWPLLLGLREITLAVMGGLFTMTNFVRTAICLFIGKKLDHNKGALRFIQGIGMGIMSISFFIRGFFPNLFIAGVGQAIGGIGHTVYALPTLTKMYLHAKPSDIVTPIAVREIILNIGRITASVIAFVLALLYEDIFGLSIMLFVIGIWCAIRGVFYLRQKK